jgi:hypothetical protein
MQGIRYQAYFLLIIPPKNGEALTLLLRNSGTTFGIS